MLQSVFHQAFVILSSNDCHFPCILKVRSKVSANDTCKHSWQLVCCYFT